MVYTLRFFFFSKCSLFHNSNVFGSCIIHILYTGCAKIKKNNSGAKRLKCIFNVCHPEVFNTYINIQRCISQTQQNFIMFIILLGLNKDRQRVSILIESSSGPSTIINKIKFCCV